MNSTKNQRKEIYIGTRKVSSQNFSKIIAIPKNALMNCKDPSHFKIYLVLEDDDYFIMLVPFHQDRQHEA